jgi:hypothetical protein
MPKLTTKYIYGLASFLDEQNKQWSQELSDDYIEFEVEDVNEAFELGIKFADFLTDIEH